MKIIKTLYKLAMMKLSNENIIYNLHKLIEILGYYLGFYIAKIINYIDV